MPPAGTAGSQAMDTRWCGDITYIQTWQGRLYLATMIGLASRRVVGWAGADHLRTEAFTDAVKRRRPALRNRLRACLELAASVDRHRRATIATFPPIAGVTPVDIGD